MSSIGSRLAGASPNFGAGYPQNNGFQNQQNSSPYHGQQAQQAPFSSPHHQSVPQVVHNGAGYNTPNNTGIIPPRFFQYPPLSLVMFFFSQITPNRASPASYASTPSHSYNPPTQSSVNSPYGYGNGSTSSYNSPHQSPYAQQQQQHHQAPRPGYGSPGYGQGYSAVPNQYGSQSVSGNDRMITSSPQFDFRWRLWPITAYARPGRSNNKRCCWKSEHGIRRKSYPKVH